ncbi:MAG: GerW family sporulation protein [Candidatus Acetothermia bacterium]
MSTTEMIERLAEDLKSYANTEAIFGDPIELQGSTVVPVCKMSVGYGGGGGEGRDGEDSSVGSGGGAGGGVKIEPAALIIASEGEVSVVAIGDKESKFESLIEMIPEAVDKIAQTAKKGKGKAEEE